MASPIGSSAQFCGSKFGFSICYIFVCHHVFVHDSFFRSLDPCVAAVFRVLLEVIFVRKGSLRFSSDFIDVDSVINYPAIRSIGWDTKFTVCHFFHNVRLQISQPGLYRSAWNSAWRFGHISDRFSSILGDSPRGGWILGVNRSHMVGYASCWSTCFLCTSCTTFIIHKIC